MHPILELLGFVIFLVAGTTIVLGVYHLVKCLSLIETRESLYVLVCTLFRRNSVRGQANH